MVGDLEKSSFSNIEQMSLEFVKYTLSPWIARWEQAMQRALFSPDEKKRFFVRFNVEGLLRGDYTSRMTGYSIARQNGWMSANDIRELRTSTGFGSRWWRSVPSEREPKQIADAARLHQIGTEEGSEALGIGSKMRMRRCPHTVSERRVRGGNWFAVS
jgi:hypothetical protein